MLKAIWFGIIDTWLAVKRSVLFTSGLSFDTRPGALVIEVNHRDLRKTIRIRTDRLDAAVDYLDRQPHGAAVVFKEGESWVIVPNFLVPEMRAYAVNARNALRRSECVSVSDPAVKSKPSTKSSLN